MVAGDFTHPRHEVPDIHHHDAALAVNLTTVDWGKEWEGKREGVPIV